MFSLKVEEKKRKVFTFYNEEKTSFSVVPERGGIVSSFDFKGSEILARDDKGIIEESGSIRGGMPLLFPICGIVKNTSFKGHGFTRDNPYNVIEYYTNDEEGVIVLEQKENEETMKVFPYKYSSKISYKIRENSLKTTWVIENKDSNNFTFFSGLHPYFFVRQEDKKNISMEIPFTKSIDIFNSIIDGGDLPYENEEINIIYNNLLENKGTIKNNDNIIDLDFNDEFKTLVFWTLKGRDFICLEPWMAFMKDDVKIENGALVLKYGEKITLEFTIKIR